MAISEEELFVFSSKDEKLDPGSADVPGNDESSDLWISDTP